MQKITQITFWQSWGEIQECLPSHLINDLKQFLASPLNTQSLLMPFLKLVMPSEHHLISILLEINAHPEYYTKKGFFYNCMPTKLIKSIIHIPYYTYKQLMESEFIHFIPIMDYIKLKKPLSHIYVNYWKKSDNCDYCGSLVIKQIRELNINISKKNIEDIYITENNEILLSRRIYENFSSNSNKDFWVKTSNKDFWQYQAPFSIDINPSSIKSIIISSCSYCNNIMQINIPIYYFPQINTTFESVQEPITIVKPSIDFIIAKTSYYIGQIRSYQSNYQKSIKDYDYLRLNQPLLIINSKYIQSIFHKMYQYGYFIPCETQ